MYNCKCILVKLLNKMYKYFEILIKFLLICENCIYNNEIYIHVCMYIVWLKNNNFSKLNILQKSLIKFLKHKKSNIQKILRFKLTRNINRQKIKINNPPKTYLYFSMEEYQ